MKDMASRMLIMPIIYKMLMNDIAFAPFEFDDTNAIVDHLGAQRYVNFGPSALSLRGYWQEWRGHFVLEDQQTIPDITFWTQNCLVLSAKAKSGLNNLLRDCGEFLPIHCQDGEYYLFNCLAREAADESKSEKKIDRGLQRGVEALAFKDTSHAVFQTPYDLTNGMYCSAEFKETVESGALSGIVFSLDLTQDFV